MDFQRAMLLHSHCLSMRRLGSRSTIPPRFLPDFLNSQPMGFYAPAQLVRDAQNHGVNGVAGRCELEPVRQHN